MLRDRVCLEYPVGVEIEARKIGVHDVIGVRHLAVSNEHDGCQLIHVG
jgi:hypothetical protein